MRSKLLVRLLFFAVCVFVMTVVPALAQDAPPNRLNYNGQDLFLSGINLAWINFARDLSTFDESRFVAVLDEIQTAKGNSLRWWLHTDGRVSPVYGEDGMVTGLGENDIEVIRRALDLAYERGILLDLCLWSHDMMNESNGVPTEFNRLLIEDPTYTQAYIDNAITPLVTALAGHPGIATWEIFNEPEGTTSEFGWTDVRTDMAHIQQFVNLLAGAIHRADPEALVTNGSWNFQVLTDIDGMTNYYTDERLIEAGGDPDGTLDFYSVHYYPEWFDETTSPFHNPASHWELDKPIVVGEFPAAGMRDIGFGYLPRRSLPYSVQTYPYLFENGYAGALSWAYTDTAHGNMLDASSGMLRIANFIDAEAVTLDIGDIDRIPVIQADIENVIVPNDTTELTNAADLSQVFSDAEDGANLTYTITENSRPDVVEVVIGEDNIVSLTFSGTIGTSSVEITGTDSGSHSSSVEFIVQVVDPNVGNVAIGKPAVSSTIESAAYAASFATDGLLDTRSSTEYADPQWLIVDLEGVFTINQVILRWEAAYGDEYDLQVWDGSAWQTVYHEALGDGDIDDISLMQSVDTRYVKFNGTSRGAEWGYSLWEFEIYGVRSETPNADLETVPPEWIEATTVVEEEAPAATTEVTQLYSFEPDTEGWVLADFWIAVTTIEHSSEMANDGEGSLALTGSFNGTEWQEGGAFVDVPEGTDWSAYNLLTVDVYVPEGATNFVMQIFTKTGDEWTWANTPDIALVAGQWNNISVDLTTLGDLTDVRQVGIKIGTSSTAFEGTFYIDNIAVVAVAEVEQPAETSAETEATLLNSFEGDAEGWVLADYWTGMSSAEPSTDMASEGTSSLALTGSFNGTEWQEGGVYFDFPEGVDWSGYSQLTVDVYVPEGATNFLAQVFVKTGADWTWANTPDISLVAGQWNTITADLSGLGNLAEVHEIGIKIGTSSTAFEGTFYVDNVSLVGAAAVEAAEPVEEVGGEPQGLVFASFESDAEGWVLADYWTAITTVEHSTERSIDGDGSLALTGTFSGTAWQEGGAFFSIPEGVDWSAYDTLTAHVYVPNGATNFLAQVFLKTGDAWTWANTPDIALTAGGWNTLTADLSTLGDLTQVHEIGIKIGTSSTAFEGTFYVDNVRLSGN
jgi:hypothetical protein